MSLVDVLFLGLLALYLTVVVPRMAIQCVISWGSILATVYALIYW